MQTSIAQTAAMVTWGNRCLRTGDAAGFYPDNSTFAFCASVSFVDRRSVWRGQAAQPYAPDPPAWFARLRNDQVRGLRLHCRPGGIPEFSDRVTVGLAGGGPRWLVEAVRRWGSDWWEARWETTGEDRPGPRIWDVTYGRIGRWPWRGRVRSVDVDATLAELRSVLSRLSAFAARHGLGHFVAAFELGLRALDAPDPADLVVHADLAPPGITGAAPQALLAAAQAAWVFGGMGSWNDLAFTGDDEETYQRISDELFTVLATAIVTAANESFPVAGVRRRRRRGDPLVP